jgi:hypothetical protein
VLRRISEPRRDETTGGWVTLRNGQLDNLYSCMISAIVSVRILRAECATLARNEKCVQSFRQ